MQLSCKGGQFNAQTVNSGFEMLFGTGGGCLFDPLGLHTGLLAFQSQNVANFERLRSYDKVFQGLHVM